MSEKQLSQTAAAIKQREWRWAMNPEKREAFLAGRKKRFASAGVHEQRERREKNPGLTARYAKDWYSRHPERARENQKLYRDRLKLEIISVYGGRCACCGEDEPLFLCLDHIVPARRPVRERMGSAWYVRLKKAGFPSGLQILCFNCNNAKGTKAECPHKRLYLKLVTATS